MQRTVKLRPFLTAALTAFALIHSVAFAQVGGRLRGAVNRPASSPASPLDVLGYLPGGSGQSVNFANASAIEQRAVGEWRTGESTLRIAPNSSTPGVHAHAVAKSPDGTEYVMGGTLMLNAEGELEGSWEHINGNMQGGPWKMRFAGNFLILEGFFATPRVHEYQFARASATFPSNAKFTPWRGEWKLADGRTLSLFEENNKLVGLVRRVQPNGLTATLHSLVFDGRQTTHEQPNDTLIGVWQRHGVPAYSGGEARMTLLPGGLAFGGSLAGSPEYSAWRGTRAPGTTQSPPGPDAPPVTQSQQPGSPSPGQSGPIVAQPLPHAPPAPPGPAPIASFKPLNRVDVRVDRVIVARGYPTFQVHAFVTVKNASRSPQYFTSGFLKAVLADADGMSWERSQPYRASGEPAELFASTPVIQPGGELKARFVFLPEVDAGFTSLTLSEGDKRAEFPVSGL